MLYYKDPKLKYTDMCIYFDWNFYTEDRDEEKLYKYLYLVAIMVARNKPKIIQDIASIRNWSWDEFGAYAAGIIWCRIEKKLWEEGIKVKSILNYTKGSIWGIFRCYVKSTFLDISDKREYLDNTESLLSQLNRESFNSTISFYINKTFNELSNKFYKEFHWSFPEANNKTMKYLYQQFLFNLSSVFKSKWWDIKTESKTHCKNLLKINYKTADKRFLGYEDFMKKFTLEFVKDIKDEVYESYESNLIPYEDAIAIQKENVTNYLIDKDNGE